MPGGNDEVYEKDPFILAENGGQAVKKTPSSPSLPQQRSFRPILIFFAFVFLFAFALVLSYNAGRVVPDGADANSEGCPGNLVLSDCPCFKRCNADGTVSDTCGNVCEEKGCGCPKDSPYLIAGRTCAASCSAVQVRATPSRDFTDCADALPKPVSRDEVLYPQKDSEVFHIRVSPTFTCGGPMDKDLDVLLHFTLLIRGQNCDKPPRDHFVIYTGNHITKAGTVACLNFNTNEFDQSIRGAWFFFAARLIGLPEDSTVVYQIGTRRKYRVPANVRSFITPLLPGSTKLDRPILVVGDTAVEGVRVVAPAAVRTAGNPSYSLAIHVGDASYATNKGDCYDERYGDVDPRSRCGYLCSGVDCHGADKIQSEQMLHLYEWAKVVDESLGGRVPWVSTMGNHDNDLGWFLTYRPPVIGAVPGVPEEMIPWKLKDEKFLNPKATNAEKQAHAMDIMKTPHFFSFDHGQMHIVSIGTEDNPINAYEVWNGEPLSRQLQERFNNHYGKDSAQYKWLVQDLERASKNREKVPWIMIYTHRPMYHTAQHHAWCTKGGDWYACLFVETYEPLLQKYGVNFFVTGHSHHYQRTYPMHNQEIVPKGTIHLLVGVGGYEVVGENWVNEPKWIASRQGTILGYARFWVKNSTSIYWEHVAAETEKILDAAWFENAFIEDDDDE